MTLSEKLLETDGRPAGFDYLRIGLALLIVVWHTVITSYGIEAQRALALGWTRPFWALILPMFFALSGFLVSGSLERSKTLVSFLGLRIIRLVPALVVESIIAMVVLGPIFTIYSMGQYIRDPLLFRYALNMVGDVQYLLPGVFVENPIDRVNAQLWTLPYELKCYIAISVFFVLRLYKKIPLFIVAFFVLQALLFIWVIARPLTDEGVVRGPVLVLAFLSGCLLYRTRDTVKWNRSIFLLSAVLSVVTLSFSWTNTLSALPVAYFTVYLGLLNPKRMHAISSGDYSYGIFLYGFPMQQAVSATLPDYRHWYINLAISAPIIIFVAYCSWHFVEKKALLLRVQLKAIESWYMPKRERIATAMGNSSVYGLRNRWVSRRLDQ